MYDNDRDKNDKLITFKVPGGMEEEMINYPFLMRFLTNIEFDLY